MLMTLLLILLFRIGCFIAIPGLQGNALESLAQNGLFKFMNLLSGNAFQQVSLFAMGISPYINASIIMQLLTVAIPALGKNAEGRSRGKKENNSDNKIRCNWFRIIPGNYVVYPS